MKLIKIHFSTCILAFSIFTGCSNSATENSDSEKASAFEFILQDSLQFNQLGTPRLADAREGHLLIFDQISNELILLDQRNAKESYRFSKKEDSPDYFGFVLGLPGILNDSTVVVPSMTGYYLYSNAGTFVKRILYPEAQAGGAFTDEPGNSIQKITINGKERILFKSLRLHDLFLGQAGFYKKYRALEITDPLTGESFEAAPFLSESKFLNGQGYEQYDFVPAFTADERQLFLINSGEPIIHAYHIQGDSLVWEKSSNLQLDGYGETSGKPLESFEAGVFSTNSFSPAIKKIALWRDKILVLYFQGMSSEYVNEITNLYNQRKAREASQLLELKLEGKEVKLLVLDRESMKSLIHVTLPPQVITEGFSLDGERFYFQGKPAPEVEEEFIKIYQFELKEKL